jgi:hypothetical protein
MLDKIVDVPIRQKRHRRFEDRPRLFDVAAERFLCLHLEQRLMQMKLANQQIICAWHHRCPSALMARMRRLTKTTVELSVVDGPAAISSADGPSSSRDWPGGSHRKFPSIVAWSVFLVLRARDACHLAPTATICEEVRKNRRPSEIAGVASTGPPMSFRASCSYLGPALTTKTWPSSFAK